MRQGDACNASIPPARLRFRAGNAKSKAADILAERLMGSGIVANDYLLGVNRNLLNPDAAPAPSRLYSFPLEFVSGDGLRNGTTASRPLLNHPLLADLSFVRRVAAITGTEPKWDPLDKFGRVAACCRTGGTPSI